MHILSFITLTIASVGLLLTPKTIAITPELPPPPAIVKSIEEIIIDEALRHGINSRQFLAVAKCESSLRPYAIGDGGNSIGLFQIHLPSHPDVTREQALDPVWATTWSAKKFKVDSTIWTCYNILFGDNSR